MGERARTDVATQRQAGVDVAAHVETGLQPRQGSFLRQIGKATGGSIGQQASEHGRSGSGDCRFCEGEGGAIGGDPFQRRDGGIEGSRQRSGIGLRAS